LECLQNLCGDDALKTRKLLAVSLVLVFVAAACSATNVTVDDIRGQSFDSTNELVALLDCDGQWIRGWDAMLTPPGVDWNAEKVADTAEVMMGTGEHPAAVDTFRAGNVWVLIDERGRPFGGLDPGHDLTWCCRYPSTARGLERSCEVQW